MKNAISYALDKYDLYVLQRGIRFPEEAEDFEELAQGNVESDLCQDIWDAIYEKLEDKLSELDEEEQA
ncbi:hypothetical protein [Levilactobacillus suantsaii]|uniref:Uncharacterized protein n=1 Tax=Levilactobacillus suantsaii TaxID=2292255 RepID=A0A4Q0VGM2_9LACO|nr:hypothetical protein [Levilactobacillus suantsaii]QMU08606.1 hypothetical protein H3M12_02755 [Levilactobacillus suantsaii]RXI77352.1 hypothetical protein DXH47_09140 [Levilactobacillus suantsaii]